MVLQRSRTILVLNALFVSCSLQSCTQKRNEVQTDDPTHEHNMADMKGMVHSSIGEDTSLLRSVALPVNFQVVSSQKSVRPSLNIGNSRIDAQGYISLDETRNHKVSAKISGRIEKLFVKYNLQYVHAGEKIMEVYSPDLNTYQEELLYLIKIKSDQELIDQAIEKLRLLGIGQDQINTIVKAGSPSFTMNVYSPQDGYVLFTRPSTNPKEKMNDAASSNESKMGGMQAASGNSSIDFVSETQQVREGVYVNKGDVLFWINDLRQVWGMIAVDNVYEQELKLNTDAAVISELYKDDTVKANINFIEPVYQPDQKFIRARIYLTNNNNKYKINSLITAKITTENKSSLWVPYSSVLFLGKRKIVWVQKETTADHNRIYEVREVITGLSHGEMIEIKKGINADDEIALNAGYLLDRESLVKPE